MYALWQMHIDSVASAASATQVGCLHIESVQTEDEIGIESIESEPVWIGIDAIEGC